MGKRFGVVLLLQSLWLWETGFAYIAQHCQNFGEEQLSDMGHSIPCEHRPGLGPFAECNVTNLKKDLLDVKTNVRTLCIYQNDDVIPSGAFSRFQSLKRLEIWGLHVKRIESQAFINLPSLASLYLLFHDSQCRDVSLANTTFQGLERLEELDLRGLTLASIPNGTFTSFPDLTDLFLKYICSNDLSDVFCLLSEGMSRLRQVTLKETGISQIRNNGCASGFKEWPTGALSQVTTLSLIGTPVHTIKPGSLKIFQNLSRLNLDIQDKAVDTIWQSGIGKVSGLGLNGELMQYLNVDLKSLCHQVNSLKVNTIELNYIEAATLGPEVVEDCVMEMENLGIWNSKIQRVDLQFWVNLTKLVSLDMVHVRMTTADFCPAPHQATSNLTSLNLAKNKIPIIKGDQFSCFPKLEILDLSYNSIKSLEAQAFQGLPHLRILRLTRNKFSVLDTDVFRWLPALQVLDLDENSISDMGYGVFRKQRQLQELRLGELDIFYRLPLNLYFYGIPSKLQYLLIDAKHGTNFVIDESIGAPNGTFIFHLNGNQIESDNCNNSLFKAVRELKVNGTQFTCYSQFLVRFFPNLESLEYSSVIDKRTTRYTGINTLRNLRRLKLYNLNFANQTDTITLFHNLNKLQILVLYNCRITFITKSMFQDLNALRVLRLYSAAPLLLLDGVFDALTSLTTVVMDKVDFRCDCKNEWLLMWAERTIQTQIVYLERQMCVWHYQKLNFLSTMERLCQTDVEYLCYLTTALSVAFVMTAAVGYNFASWPFWVLFFRVQGWLERRIGQKRRRNRRGEGLLEEVEEEEEEEGQFDAFVSFSSKDEGWVLRELVPRLEQEGEPRLQLCLHNRDFEVGKGIVDNIAESIYRSRRTICVLSRRYLRSDWCSLELRVATHRLLAEQKHRLILIFLEHISPFELSAFHRLTKLVKSHTYLDWPEEEAERVNFWERLRRSIIIGPVDCAEER